MTINKPEGERRLKKSVRAEVRKAAKKLRPQATLRNHQASARKVRLVVDLIRGKAVGPALRILAFCDKAASEPVTKLLRSAIANADELGFDVEGLFVQEAFVNEGRTLKRFRPRAQGRATRIRHRSSHTTIVLGQAVAEGQE